MTIVIFNELYMLYVSNHMHSVIPWLYSVRVYIKHSTAAPHCMTHTSEVKRYDSENLDWSHQEHVVFL